MDNLELEKYWNEKHPQQKVIYSGRSISKKCGSCGQHYPAPGLKIDVRNMIQANDHLLQELIQNNNLKGSSHDETMIKIQRWVVSNLRYVGDEQNEGVLEHWQFPFETIESKIGDCEDGAILIASLALNAGVPSFRIRVAAGFVQEAPTAPQGGHGYCTYLRESDNEWVVLDWCYFENSNLEIKDKPAFKNHSYYKEIWFSFNNLYSWGNKEFEITQRIAKEK